MSHPTIPKSPRFMDDATAMQRIESSARLLGKPAEWFICGDNTWRPICQLKAYDAKHGTHYAEDCADAARAAFLDDAVRCRNIATEALNAVEPADEFFDDDLSTAREHWPKAEQAESNADAWAAWGEEK